MSTDPAQGETARELLARDLRRYLAQVCLQTPFLHVVVNLIMQTSASASATELVPATSAMQITVSFTS